MSVKIEAAGEMRTDSQGEEDPYFTRKVGPALQIIGDRIGGRGTWVPFEGKRTIVGNGGCDILMDPQRASKLLADEYSVKILTATYRKARSASYLSSRFDIPIAACYRRIKALEKEGFLKAVEKEFTRFGKWVWTYRSNLKYVNIVLEKGQMRMFMQLNDPKNPEHHDTWEILEQEEV
jgi:hypothetical protein